MERQNESSRTNMTVPFAKGSFAYPAFLCENGRSARKASRYYPPSSRTLLHFCISDLRSVSLALLSKRCSVPDRIESRAHPFSIEQKSNSRLEPPEVCKVMSTPRTECAVYSRRSFRQVIVSTARCASPIDRGQPLACSFERVAWYQAPV